MKSCCTHQGTFIFLPFSVWFFRFPYHMVFLKFLFICCHIDNNSSNFFIAIDYDIVGNARGRYPAREVYKNFTNYFILKDYISSSLKGVCGRQSLASLPAPTLKNFCSSLHSVFLLINIYHFPRSLKNPLSRWWGRLIFVHISLDST